MILDNSARCPMPVRNEEREESGCVEYMGVIDNGLLISQAKG
jgi:hypothetical protein